MRIFQAASGRSDRDFYLGEHGDKTCPWTGTAADATLIESPLGTSEYHCPDCDFKMLRIIPKPGQSPAVEVTAEFGRMPET